MKCASCGTSLNAGDMYEHAGETLCEDCYMDRMGSPKACDPWAVYTAKQSMKHNTQLTDIQQRILDLLKRDGPLSAEEICRRLKIDDGEFRTNFTVLRHMEKARACKRGEEICYTLFEDPEN